MNGLLRVIDTGLMAARWNVAMTAALVERHVDGLTMDTLRFHRYPASVLVGRHQILSDAVNTENCMRDNVEIARRVTGGGAVYMAPGALAWDLVIDRKALGPGLPDASRIVGEALADAFSRLGLAANYHPDNGIEVAGRKICGMSGYTDGKTLVCQGTVLVTADLRDMAKYLKLTADGSARMPRDVERRVATVRKLLGRSPTDAEFISAIAESLAQVLNRELAAGTLHNEECQVAEDMYRHELGQDAFVYGVLDVMHGLSRGSVPVSAKAQP